MDKKGLILHWIFYGVLVAVGIFFLGYYELNLDLDLNGKWQIDFLKNYYLEGERDLLEIDYKAKLAGKEAIGNLAKNGGFFSENNCGKLDSYNLWNNQKQFCFPQIEKEFSFEFQKQLKKQLPQRTYSNIKLIGETVSAKGDKKSIISKNPMVNYTYLTGFKVNLGVNLEKEYLKLKEEANNLLNCRNSKELEKCLKKEKKSYWKFSNCQQERYQEKQRKVSFCINKTNPYYLALDFTPIKIFAVEKVQVSSEDSYYLVIFPSSEITGKYRIYYTTDLTLKNKKGDINEIKSQKSASKVWDYQEFDLNNLIKDKDKCKSGVKKEVNQAYWCDDKIFFTLFDSNLNNLNFLVGVTLVKNNQESELLGFVQYT